MIDCLNDQCHPESRSWLQRIFILLYYLPWWYSLTRYFRSFLWCLPICRVETASLNGVNFTFHCDCCNFTDLLLLVLCLICFIFMDFNDAVFISFKYLKWFILVLFILYEQIAAIPFNHYFRSLSATLCFNGRLFSVLRYSCCVLSITQCVIKVIHLDLTLANWLSADS